MNGEDVTVRQRVSIVVALFLLSVITYVDRTAISTAKDGIESQLHISESAMGLVFSAFAIGYAGAQIPAGWIADRIGPRRALAIAVAAWSILTSLTGAAWSLASLLLIRLFFGVGEAAVFPGAARVIRNWLPPRERGRANGALFAGSRIGAALSYPLLVFILRRWEWRRGFLLLGVAGVAWAAFWFLWFRDRPNVHMAQSALLPADVAEAGVRPAQLNSRLIIALLGQYFASNFTNFICLSWMFPYLRDTFHLSASGAALYSMPPLLFGATALSVSGLLVDRLYLTRFSEWSRKLPAIAGFMLAVVGLLTVTQVHSLHAAVAAFTVAIFGADMTVGPSWVACGDVGGEKTGRISGAMNMLGSIGAFVSANAFPILHQLTGSTSTYFLFAAALNALAVLCWMNLRSLILTPREEPVR